MGPGFVCRINHWVLTLKSRLLEAPGRCGVCLAACPCAARGLEARITSECEVQVLRAWSWVGCTEVWMRASPRSLCDFGDVLTLPGRLLPCRGYCEGKLRCPLGTWPMVIAGRWWQPVLLFLPLSQFQDLPRKPAGGEGRSA